LVTYEKNCFFFVNGGGVKSRNEYQQYSLEVKGGQFIRLTTLPPSFDECLEILGASTSWKPKDLSRPVQGYFYRYKPYGCSLTVLSMVLATELNAEIISKLTYAGYYEVHAARKNLKFSNAHLLLCKDKILGIFLVLKFTCSETSPVLEKTRTYSSNIAEVLEVS
jgi:hypothetical protein